MKLQNFIIGLLFFIAASLVILTLVADMYGPYGYDVDLDSDNYTKWISVLKENVTTAQSETDVTSSTIYKKTPGQIDSTLKEGDGITEGDMIASSIKALSSIGDYFDVFISMMGSLFDAVGIGTKGPIFWFFISGFMITIALLLVSSVLRNVI